MGAANASYGSLGAMGLGTIIGAQGAQESASATAETNTYLAAVARNNQAIAEQYAQQSEQRGERQAQMKELDTAARAGAVAATAGASGLDPTGGSPLRLSADTMAMGNLDARTIRFNAAKEAYGFRTQASSYGAQAVLDERAAENARRAGDINALGTIINGAGMISGKWAGMQSTGALAGGGAAGGAAGAGFLDAGSTGLVGEGGGMLAGAGEGLWALFSEGGWMAAAAA